MVFSPSAAFAASMAEAKAVYQLVLPPTVSDAAICLPQMLQVPLPSVPPLCSCDLTVTLVRLETLSLLTALSPL